MKTNRGDKSKVINYPYFWAL